MSLKLGNKAGSSTINEENRQEKRLKLKEQFQHLSDADLGYAKRNVKGIIYKLQTKIVKALEYRKEGLLNYIEAQ